MILLVTGQSASGKSEYAEKRAMEMHEKSGSRLFYLATMEPFGEDARMRIERHHALRKGKGFETIERYTDLLGLVMEKETETIPFPRKARGSTVLLECMSNLMANEIFSPSGSGSVRAVPMILEGIHALSKVCENLIIVTVNVFEDGKTYDEDTNAYIQCLGQLNSHLAEISDEFVEVIYSIPVVLKENLK